MGNKKNKERSRRGFLTFLLTGKENNPGTTQAKPEMVKMLTADGKLVEVSKTIVDEMSKKQKASNKEIYAWMKNPSKENS